MDAPTPCGPLSRVRHSLLEGNDGSNLGEAIYTTAAEIFPICRSLTGNGVRETLSRLSRLAPITVHEVPTGTQVFDWKVPKEWNIREAWIKDPSGRTVIDFADSSLHVLNGSAAVHQTLPLSELKSHIFTLPDLPDLVPYRTAYTGDRWGFCMPHRLLEALPDGPYYVKIDSNFEDGTLSYGEVYLPGETDEEVLLSAHICHPSLANDNCSGLALLTHLTHRLAATRTRYSYRILFAPGTIGAITWLARNPEAVQRIRHGVVLSCVGDAGGPTYKRSRRGAALIDRAFSHVLRQVSNTPNIIDFFPYGYDERQYCSPGFNLPVGLFQRSQFGTFPQYHTSADNLDFITPEALEDLYRMVVSALEIIETDRPYRNTSPYCEPQLGRRGLYSAIGGNQHLPEKNLALLWVLNLSDGQNSLLDIADRSGLPYALILEAAARLKDKGLLI